MVKARRRWSVLRSGTVTIGELAANEGVTQSYAARAIRLAHLSRAVTAALLAGQPLAGVTATKLMAEGAIAPDWQTQQAMLLPE